MKGRVALSTPHFSKPAKSPRKAKTTSRNAPHNEDLGSFSIIDSVDRDGAKNIIKEIMTEYNIKIDNKEGSYRKLTSYLQGNILLKFINQIACLAAMGSRTSKTYDFCKKNMVACEEEMKIAKENAQQLKKVQPDMLSAINLFQGDDILPQANSELQLSSSDQGSSTSTGHFKINDKDVSYHELAIFFKRKIISQLIEHEIGWLAQGSSLHEAHKNFKQYMKDFEDAIKGESEAATKLINASAHMLSSIQTKKMTMN